MMIFNPRQTALTLNIYYYYYIYNPKAADVRSEDDVIDRSHHQGRLFGQDGGKCQRGQNAPAEIQNNYDVMWRAAAVCLNCTFCGYLAIMVADRKSMLPVETANVLPC